MTNIERIKEMSVAMISIAALPNRKRFRGATMKIPENVKNLAKSFCCYCVSVYNDYSIALNDYARMCEWDNKIISVSSCAFCRAFSNVAKRISCARANKIADTYCSLADKAVEMLVSGISEADTLCYFDKLLRKEIEGERK